MQFIRIALSSTARAIHPIDDFVQDHEAVEREALLDLDARTTDGTTTLLYRLSGDPGRLAAALDTHERVAAHELVDCDDGFHAFVRAESCAAGGELIDVAHRHGLIIDTPLTDGEEGLRVTLVGPEGRIREALSDLPDGIAFDIHSAGDYRPGNGELLSPLTERQLETIQTAFEEGYYEIPRRVTHKDIAETLDCSPSTVDEHLRRAEARVVTNLIQ